MLTTSIRYIVQSIKTDIANLLVRAESDSNIIYDVAPLVETTNKMVDLIERNGMPKYEVERVRATEPVTAEYFNMMSKNIYDILNVSSKLIDELTEKTNESTQEYGALLNQIEPAMQSLKRDLADLESQTLEKVTNVSIFDHEIKNIDFAKTVRSSNMTYIYGTLLLPIVSSETYTPYDHVLSILESKEATKRLDQPLVATEDKTDAETIIGTYFGNIVGKLDGTEAFIGEDEFELDNIHNDAVNQSLQSNYYSDIPNDNFKIKIRNQLNQTGASQVNFIRIKSNVNPMVSLTMEDGMNANVSLHNGVWTSLMSMTDISITLEQTRPERLKYQGIDVYRGDNIVKRHNYFTSMAYKLPTELRDLNDTIETSEIEVSSQDRLIEADRTGFYKYHIDLNQVEIKQHVYAPEGEWVSNLITTEFPIQAVEIISDFYIPDDLQEYITYHISFDNITWHPIKSKDEGLTTFNYQKKSRIVLSNLNDNDEYLFIGEQEQNLGLYLRVNMKSTNALNAPAIYNVKLRIKVDTNE